MEAKNNIAKLVEMESAKKNEQALSSWQFQQLAQASLDAGNACYNDCKKRDEEFASGNTKGQASFMAINVVFLYFRSIELAIKAAIQERNLATPNQIRSKALGHNLKALLECATTTKQSYTLKELGLNSQAKVFLDRWSDDYASKWFEYHFKPWQIPDLARCQMIAESVVKAIEPIARTLNPFKL
jgi:hypothetical protein